MTELPLVEVLSIPVTTITSDPSKLRVLIKHPRTPTYESRVRFREDVERWLRGETQVLCLFAEWELSLVVLEDSQPIIVEAK